MEPYDRRRGPGLAIAIVVVALAVGGLAAVEAIRPFASTLRSSTPSVPGVVHRHLGPGTYVIFERTGTARGLAGIGVKHDTGVTINASQVQVQVVSAGGALLPVSDSDGSRSITRDSRRFTSAVEFKVPATGDFDIRIASRQPTQVLIARALGETVRSVVGWIVTAALAAVAFIVGIIMWIVRSSRRRRSGGPGGAGWPGGPDGSGSGSGSGAPGRRRWRRGRGGDRPFSPPYGPWPGPPYGPPLPPPG